MHGEGHRAGGGVAGHMQWIHNPLLSSPCTAESSKAIDETQIIFLILRATKVLQL